jgi:hypothetical protein
MIFKKNHNKNIVNNDVYLITAKEFGEKTPEERQKWWPVPRKYEKVPKICKFALILLAISLVIYVVSCLNEGFADFFNLYVSNSLRFLLAKLTNLLPFSFAELIIILLPVIAFISIWYLVKYRCNTPKSTVVSLVCIVSAASTLLSCFILCFGVSYKCSGLDKKLGIRSSAVDRYELYDTADYLLGKINALAEQTSYGDDDFSAMPYSFDEMNEKLLEAYDRFAEKYPIIVNFKSRLKPVMASEAMSYTHITGVYTFFTGESNINVNFPDYTIPYTSAHELAHQRGIAREDEANMVAFLVCIESDDPYIQYSAYLNVYEYVSSALYSADKELYSEIRSKLDTRVRNEQIAYSRFFDKYEKSVASQVSGAVNDVYLKTQGTQGKVSYGMVVDLTVAYLKSQSLIESSEKK